MVETRLTQANKILKLVGIGFVSLIVLLLVFLGSLCLFGGYKILWVQGDSSIQKIPPFSLILVQPCDVSELKARNEETGEFGDFAVRASAGTFVTHEVIYVAESEEEWVFDTKQYDSTGTAKTDAEKFNSGKLFNQDDLVGKVVYIEWFVGKAFAWVQGYTNLGSSIKTAKLPLLAVIRVGALACIVMAISKFSENISYKEDIC